MGQPAYDPDATPTEAEAAAAASAAAKARAAPPASQQQKEALEDSYNNAASAAAAARQPSSTSGLTDVAPNMNAPTPGTRAAQLPPEAIALATRMFNCAREGDTATLQQYVEAGIPANLTNGSGDTLLMLAAYHNHVGTVRRLLELGADPDALNDKGQSPLAGAVFKGYEEVVRLLVEQGKADARKGQPSAVECAQMFRRNDLLQLLTGSS